MELAIKVTTFGQKTTYQLNNKSKCIEKNERYENVIYFFASKIEETSVLLEEDTRNEVVHGYSEGFKHLISINTKCRKKCSVNMPNHNQYNAQTFHQIDEW